MATTILSYALTSLQDVKETLGINAGTTTSDNLLTRKINQATEMIERYCGRRFKATTYTDEEYDATYGSQLILRQRPINTLTSISQRNSTQNISSWDAIDPSFYFYDANAGLIEGVFSFGVGFGGGGWNRYKVTYNAGYTTIPSDLAEACVTLAAYLFKNPTSGTGVKSQTEGSRRIEYFDTARLGEKTLVAQLSLDDILDSYANYPMLENK